MYYKISLIESKSCNIRQKCLQSAKYSDLLIIKNNPQCENDSN